MKVILWQSIENLGKKGDIVEVKEGYARNYLFPKKLASPAKPGYIKQFNLVKRKLEKIEMEQIEKAKNLAEKIEQMTLEIKLHVNPEGKVYGGVTPTVISTLLREKGINISAKIIQIDKSIKQLGEFTIPVKLYKDTTAQLKIIVSPIQEQTPQKEEIS
jgi:large subunit ribosomal protein L9